MVHPCDAQIERVTPYPKCEVTGINAERTKKL